MSSNAVSQCGCLFSSAGASVESVFLSGSLCVGVRTCSNLGCDQGRVHICLFFLYAVLESLSLVTIFMNCLI